MNELTQQIEQTLKNYRDCWARLDFAALRELWDPEEPEPAYLAEEKDRPMFGWGEIEAYWTVTRRTTRSIDLETWNLRAHRIAPELATAVYEMRWKGEFEGYARPIGGDTRVSAILRRRLAGWRFIHYIEAPLAPIVYFRHFYERFAAAPPQRGS